MTLEVKGKINWECKSQKRLGTEPKEDQRKDCCIEKVVKKGMQE